MRKDGLLLAGIYAEALILADGGWRGRCTVEVFIEVYGQEADEDECLYGMLKGMCDARRNELIQWASGEEG